ncbi:uncharacterized protein Z518_08575 [Rhinocladiella mackenziei CBS 650.93]|uniref:Altered inheritance of mitochondria protein 41 n=1 Tax=Rhinocladiella mackenziei CBS 650.93 TaxID=1442369 RepID=A0A0D2GWM7_9EURO|nr:uncharacterized protein Z518_08575 [Rhinocladiella mackenziei CBS 650.93]KIX02633.1 hypothetical protein Z518_08575 [Rhinocladiella mackenziei CBS 650.93]
MTTTRTSRLWLLAEPPVCLRCMHRSSASGLRWTSSASTVAPATPLLTKIKNDLKAAMRAKDTARLSVLRATISEINQAASGPTPIKTDMQVLALLRKRKSASEAAAKEAQEAKRPDLVEKQEKEMAVVDELTSSVRMMDPQEMRKMVQSTIETLKGSTQGELKPGVVMKELLKPGGELTDKQLERRVLAELVREELSNQTPS